MPQATGQATLALTLSTSLRLQRFSAFSATHLQVSFGFAFFFLAPRHVVLSTQSGAGSDGKESDSPQDPHAARHATLAGTLSADFFVQRSAAFVPIHAHVRSALVPWIHDVESSQGSAVDGAGVTGALVGFSVGSAVGLVTGALVGFSVGLAVGLAVGLDVFAMGIIVGLVVGSAVLATDGAGVTGALVGFSVGSAVGLAVGLVEGSAVGSDISTIVGSGVFATGIIVGSNISSLIVGSRVFMPMGGIVGTSIDGVIVGSSGVDVGAYVDQPFVIWFELQRYRV